MFGVDRLCAGDARHRIASGNGRSWASSRYSPCSTLRTPTRPPPASVTALAWAAMVGWLIPVFGWWVDRHRAVV